MKIVLDAFGGDNCPNAMIKGARLAVDEFNVEVCLVGNKEKIEQAALNDGVSLEKIQIVDAADVFTMHDEPTEILKSKKNSSMAVALKMVADGDGDAFVSAGSTGAIVVGSTFIIKRIKGIKRAAIASTIPGRKGNFLLLDCGANAECRPEMLAQFGVMASAYLSGVENKENPSIGLLNIGVEETKGGSLQLEAYNLLKNAPINFVGNVEARDIPLGECNGVVADGFTGNVALKLYEGVSLNMFGMLKDVFKKSLKTKIAAAMVMPGLKGIKKKADYSEIGGAPLLGLRKPVIKAHGSSNEIAIKNAIRQAIAFADNNVVETITKNIEKLSNNNNQEGND